MKKLSLLLLCILFNPLADAQNGSQSWLTKVDNATSFIENKGQFHTTNPNEKVLYALDNGTVMIYFTQTGITYSFLKRWKKEKDGKEETAEKNSKNAADHLLSEKEEHKMEFKTDVVSMTFANSNPNAQLIGEQQANDYFSYNIKENNTKRNINFIKGYKKLIYKNIYPNIDIEYTIHPVDGIKYNLILHPGAEYNKIKFDYSRKVKQDELGNILINTAFGNIMDHSPISFYEGNRYSIINSHFIAKGKSVTFSLAYYDDTRTAIIDPWVQTPTINNSNGVWECEKDAAGNVYIIGGDMPMKLIKYNSLGAIQWTHNTPYDTANYWLGTFATDLAGNSYVTAGSIAELEKVTTAGTQVYNVGSGLFSSDEYWHIAFNCDQTRLIIGGTSATALINLRGTIFDIDPSNGNIITRKIVGYGNAFGFPTDIQEVRSITSSYNARYYFLTLDSLGCVEQNLSACPGAPPTLFDINSGHSFSYKSENYRPNNGNSGICAIAANKNFVYTVNGVNVYKRNLNTGAIITTAAIPAGASTTTFGQHQIKNCGIDIDSCGNVYVGSTNAVLKYDANLVLLQTVSVPFKVYDVCVSYGGNVIATGATGDNSVNVRTGYVQSIPMTSCNPKTLICCDANICPHPPACITDAPFNFTSITGGGVWSGTGITNAATGTFSPTVAGSGVFTITYTLACGSSSINMTVTPCTTVNLTACAETNGNITVSNSIGTVTWYNSATTIPCNPGFGTFCGIFTVAGAPVTTWTSFATGTTATPAGAYPFWVVDAIGDSLQITSFASLAPCVACPTLIITPSLQVNVLCFGGSTGSFSITTSGGASPYDYTLTIGSVTVAAFTNVAGTQAFTGLGAGTYTLNVLDDNACPGTFTITITQPATAVSVAITATTPATCGSSNGSASTLASGGTSPYDYVWTNSASTVVHTDNNITTTSTASALPSGTYTVVVTDANGCTTSTTVTITNTGGPNLSLNSQTDVLCFGGSTGSATVSVSGGTSPYDYVWTNAASTVVHTDNNITIPSTATGLTAGVYTVTVTDASGCIGTFTVTITQPATAVSVVITATTPASCGSSTGSASAQASNGTSPYDYVWTNSASTVVQTDNNITTVSTANGLASGSYTVTVTDGNGCVTSTTTTITSTGGGTVSITSQTNVLCFGASTGSATANIVGGTSPYDYVWTNASSVVVQTDNNIIIPSTANGLPAGVYTITVTDLNGCVSTTTVTITQPAIAFAVAITATSPAPCGSSTGSATAQASGGTSPYDYVWTNSSSTVVHTDNNITTPSSATALPAGVYTVTVTDANGCITTTTATITNVGGATVSITSQVNVLCFGASTGSAVANSTGGTSPYDYIWTNSLAVTVHTDNNITTPSTATGLAAGVYTVTVTDASGCVSSVTVTITQPATAFAVVPGTINNATCGLSNGSASVTASGGTVGTGYIYSWAPSGGSGSSASGLGANTYTVTVTDANNCTTTTTVVILNTGGPTVTVTSQVNVICFGGNTGSATVNATGGTGTYTYLWTSSSSTTNSASGLAAGTYTVTVNDGVCTGTATVVITQNPQIIASVGSTPSICSGATGTATVTASGGSGTLTYVWDVGGSSATIVNVASGLVNVTITDALGCSTIATGSVGSTGGPTANAGVDVTIISGQSTTLNGTNATGSSYLWSPAATLSSSTSAIVIASPTVTTTYILMVTDGNGCHDWDTVTVFVDPNCGTLFVPEAFSPNMDGANDSLLVFGNCITELDFAVYDRWGEKVWTSNSELLGWDGTYKGQKLDAAVFVWYLKAVVNTVNVDMHGNVMLVR